MIYKLKYTKTTPSDLAEKIYTLKEYTPLFFISNHL